MWSRNFNECINCGTTSVKHLAKGLCVRCYSRINEKKQNKIAKHKRGVAVKLLTKEKLIDLYITRRFSLGEIGKLVGTSRTNVHTKLKQFNIPTRDRAESRTIALDSGKIQYNFTNTEGETERKKYNNVVKGEGYSFSIGNNLLYKQLTELGVTPNKSLILEFPSIPREYARHFIRGCWDGDGTVYIEKRNGHLKTAFVCGSLSFIKRLMQYLEDAGLSKRKLYSDTRSKGNNTSYYFRYATKDSIRLFQFLYHDVTEDQYLKRKYDIFSNYLKKK